MDAKKYSMVFVSWVAVLLCLIILTVFVFKIYLPFAEILFPDISKLHSKALKIIAIWIFLTIFSVICHLAVKNSASLSKIIEWFIKINRKGPLPPN